MGAEFWVAVGLFILLGIIAYYKVPQLMAKSLDQRRITIQNELAEAVRLREEAESLLKDYTNKKKQAEHEALQIIETAKEEAALLSKSMAEKLVDLIARQTEAAEERIKQDKKNAVKDVNNAAADATILIASQVLRYKFSSPETASHYLDNAISNLKSGLQ